MKTKLKQLGLFFPVLLLVLFSSCYYDYNVNSDNYDIVATSHNSAYDFSTVQRYYLIDSVSQFNGGGAATAYNSYILSTTVTNLNSLGWTRVVDTAQADVVISTGTTATNYVYNSGGYNYWNWWGYSWYDPYYYGSVSSYSTGTLVILLTDLKKKDGSKLPVQWAAVINGVLNQGNAQQRLLKSINQAFTQSPYL